MKAARARARRKKESFFLSEEEIGALVFLGALEQARQAAQVVKLSAKVHYNGVPRGTS